MSQMLIASQGKSSCVSVYKTQRFAISGAIGRQLRLRQDKSGDQSRLLFTALFAIAEIRQREGEIALRQRNLILRAAENGVIFAQCGEE